MKAKPPDLRVVAPHEPALTVPVSAFLGLKAEIKTVRKSLGAERQRTQWLEDLISKMSIAVAVLSAQNQPNGANPVQLICAATGLSEMVPVV